MEKAIFKEKIDSLMPDLVNALQKECLRLFDSGGIDTSKYEDNYLLPKIIFTVALKNQIWQYRPLTSDSKKEVKNLECF